MASLWFRLPTARAEVTPYEFTAKSAAHGLTLKLDTGAELGVFGGVIPGPATVTWTTTSDPLPTLPEKHTPIGPVYRLTITGQTALNTERRRLGIAIPDMASEWARQIWAYDLTTQQWQLLETKLNPKTGKLQAGLDRLDVYLVLLEDPQTQEGIASWYCKRRCSPSYPALHGTSNDFPVGSYVKVTSQETKKSVVVKIVSGWGQPAGRVVDLSWAAYAKLQTKNTGVTKVNVNAAKTPTGSPVTSPVIPAAETIPELEVQTTGTAVPPAVKATGYTIIDAASGDVLVEKNADQRTPIASLTKLMTAVVFLDTKPDLEKVVTYTKADVTAYAYLRIKPGETLTLRNLFYSMLVGSANNAATALARSTGLSRATFLDRMNAQAKAWGMASTSFTDVSGLDPKNTSTARDVAILANHAFHEYPYIRQATTMTNYTFTTKNTKKTHVIKTTDQLLLKPNQLTISGGKTGFLDEAKYTYALRVKNAQQAQVVVALLGSPTSAQRFTDAAALATWAIQQHTWQ